MTQDLLKIAVDLIESLRESVAGNCGAAETATLLAAARLIKLAGKAEAQ